MASVNYDRYRGPPHFEDTPEDHRLFFGRAGEIDTIVQQTIASRLLVLFGKSGLGKTSLLLAGVFPRLRAQDLLPIRVRLAVSVAPLELIVRVAESTSRQFGVDFVPGDASSLWEFFKTAMFWRGDSLLTPVLVFDQFEEIFTIGSRESRAAFTREIGPLVSGNPPEAARGRLRDVAPAVKTILSFREEYLGALQELSAEIPGLFQERFRLRALSVAQAREAIEQPALLDGATQAAGEAMEFSTPPFQYEKQTLDEIVAFLRGRSESIEPFQLQLVCQHIEKVIVKRLAASGGPVRVRADDLGGRAAMETVLRRFYTDSLAALPRRQRRRAQELCETGLLTPAGHRLMLQEDQIHREYRVGEATLELLVDKRLLRKEPRLESVFYELSHDTLAQPILRMRHWRIPRKWRPVLALSAIAAAIILVLVGAFVRRLTQERQNSDQARVLAEEQRTHAEDLLGFLIGEELLGRIRPIGRLEVLDKIQKEVDGYLKKLPEQGLSEVARRDKALGHLNQGDLLDLKGQVEAARREYESAVRYLGGENTRWQHDYANAIAKLGDIAVEQGHLQEAARQNRAARDIRRKLLTGNAAADDSIRREIAENCATLGSIYMDQGRVAESLASYEEAVDIANRQWQGSPEKTKWIAILQRGHRGRAVALTAQRRLDDADLAMRENMKYAQQLEQRSRFEPEAHHTFAVAMLDRANLSTYEHPAEVLPEYQRGHAFIRQVAEWDQANVQWQREVAATVLLLGEGYARRGETATALRYYRKAFQTLDALAKIDATNASLPADLVWAQRDIVDALMETSAYQEALNHCDAALDVLRRLASIDETNTTLQDEVCVAYERKANALKANQQVDAAIKTYQQAIAAAESRRYVDPQDMSIPEVINSLQRGIADAFSRKQDRARALRAYQAAVRTISNALSRTPDSAYCHHLQSDTESELASFYGNQHNDDGRYRASTAAEQSLQRAVRLKRNNDSYWHDLYNFYTNNDGTALRRDQGAVDEARVAAAESASTAEPKNASYRHDLASAYQAAAEHLAPQNPVRALTYYTRAEQTLAQALRMKNDDQWWNELLDVHRKGIVPLTAKTGGAAAVQAARESELRAIRKALELKPRDTGYHSRAGQVYQQLGAGLQQSGQIVRALDSYLRAAREYRDAEALSPLVLLYYRDISPVCSSHRDLVEAATSCKETAAVVQETAGGATDFDHRAKLAAAYRDAGQNIRPRAGDTALELFHKSEGEFREALKLKPNDAGTWYQLASLWFEDIAPVNEERGDWEAAIDAYRHAQAGVQRCAVLDPKTAHYLSDSSLAWQKIADLLEQHGQGAGALDAFRRAVEWSQKAVAQDLKEGWPLAALGHSQELLGDALQRRKELSQALAAYAAAEQEYRQAAALDPKDGSSSNSLALLLSRHIAAVRDQMGDHAGARQAYEGAILAIGEALVREPKNAAYLKARDELQAEIRAGQH